MLTHVLAHGSGWDEALFVAGPIVVIGALIWLANRRANAFRAQATGDGDPAGPDDDRPSDAEPDADGAASVEEADERRS